eukprot:CAMPEP_0178391114 /NCGR_PEP_ID=MMETSP0689_2-20121128/10997_1 /TAXON_ID=160604 /ORGANISM="Amphidinium massartii, Strain CS-259" /LENGTH=772 /DNA_ID=CAMNT_0020011649 /DNA_START=80 /DNA_END=2396 /DNA_ORIENTATION=-
MVQQAMADNDVAFVGLLCFALIARRAREARPTLSPVAVPDQVLGEDPVARRLLNDHESLQNSDQYKVKFNGKNAQVFMNLNPKQNGHDGSNNLAQFTMVASGDSYEPVTVEVTSQVYSKDDGEMWNIRPTRYWEELKIVKEVDESKLKQGVISFTVTEPCQISVELGEPSILFTSKTALESFSNLILAFNPPESEWPHSKPTLTKGGSKPECASAEADRDCIVYQADSSCDLIETPKDTDIYFSSRVATSYVWGTGDGCGFSPKEIWLQGGARLFLDEGVVVYARIYSRRTATGVFGYGIFSMAFMEGYKDKNLNSIVNMQGDDTQIYGVTLMDSTYRNIRVGLNAQIFWTKNFAWLSETDCVATTGTGMRVYNNFFKTNDDCMKPYFLDTIFKSNVVWHQGTGRAIMLSWGNAGMNEWNMDASCQVLDTYIIHDSKAWSVPDPDPATPLPLAYQAQIVGYGALVCIQHPNANNVGLPNSPVLIENLFVEEQIGILIIITNGFAQLNGGWEWQATDEGCTGDVNLLIRNLDIHRVTGVASRSIIGGCDIDYVADNIENGHCLCTSDLGCSGDKTCAAFMRVDGHSNPITSGVPSLEEMLDIGMNTEVSYGEGTTTSTTEDSGGLPWWAWFLVAIAICLAIICLCSLLGAVVTFCCGGDRARRIQCCEEAATETTEDFDNLGYPTLPPQPPYFVPLQPQQPGYPTVPPQSGLPPDDPGAPPPYRIAAMTPLNEQQPGYGYPTQGQQPPQYGMWPGGGYPSAPPGYSYVPPPSG